MSQPNLAPVDIAEGNVRRVEHGEVVDEPSYMSELPDINPIEYPNDPAVQRQKSLQMKYFEYLPHTEKDEIIHWDIPHEPIVGVPADKDNTQNAVEEYFVHARRRFIKPEVFLSVYYEYANPPEYGVQLTRDEYSLYKARLLCDRTGVDIPRMDGICQTKIYFHLLEAARDMYKKKHGYQIQPRPPYVFDPIFNKETNRYEAND